jgi:aminomethyltransferase
MKTTLYDEHVSLGAKMVEFAGWQMPVEYSGLRDEHNFVRRSAGLFDVSHMGEIRVLGAKSLATLQWLTTNDVAALKEGEAQYSLLPNERGGLVDDIIVYCLKPNEDYLVCVNAANTEKDWQHFVKHNRGAELKNQSAEWGQIAIQGPKAISIVQKIFGDDVLSIKRFSLRKINKMYFARTGYTGEDGFEIFVPWADTVSLWKALLSAGGEDIKPCGLGARDTLRIEMKYSLYGNEINDSLNPYAAGLGWVIKPKSKDFLGREPMVSAKEAGALSKLIGLKLTGKGIPRSGYAVLGKDNKPIGRITSGTLSPSTGDAIGIAYIDKEYIGNYSSPGAEIWVDIRGRPVPGIVVETPFYKSEQK